MNFIKYSADALAVVRGRTRASVAGIRRRILGHERKMFIQHNGKTYCSVREISRKANYDEKFLLDVVSRHQIETVDIENVTCIEKAGLKHFFGLISDATETPKYGLPFFLADRGGRCWSVLAEIYNMTIAFPASLSPHQGEFLRSIVLNIAPEHVVEIGCFIGVSSIWIASALEDNNKGVVHSIDLFNDIFPSPPYTYGYLEDPLAFAKSKVRLARLEHRVNFHKGDSVAIGKKYCNDIGKRIDLLFIDGDHTVEGCRKDFKLYEPYVNVGGYILLHDIYPDHCGWDGPRYLIDKILKKENRFEVLEMKTTPNNFGMALARKLE
ncbi:MAG: class I SAM-dependent methyltransferase [Thermodesulfobacteriota bacterium]|nr:class I SAM-dependent methyltransferase [Thermodesulfobacteriota bacterium]